jgi:hypothetical protein
MNRSPVASCSLKHLTMTAPRTPHGILERVLSAIGLFFPAIGGRRYRATPMLSNYVGEENPGNTVWHNSHVRYLTEAERAPFALTFRDGKIWGADGNLYDTTDAVSLHSDSGRAIFVMDADGNFYAAKDHRRGKFHHSSLVAGAPVAAAGELAVVRGVLTAISDKSGHYLPRRPFTAQAIDHLEKNNISLEGVTRDLIGKP